LFLSAGRKHVSRLALTFALALQLAAAADLANVHLRNFAQVNDHIYRGGQPTATEIEQLGAIGIKLVIDLRGTDDARDSERREIEKLGIHYKNVPFPAFSAPSRKQMEEALGLLLQSDSDPVFVHCLRGKDRTGTLIACYRIQHDHWENRQALEEAKHHGLSVAERGMRSYIAHFEPLTPAELLFKPTN
jgi:tyrosine-protein phosphatase SIW14